MNFLNLTRSTTGVDFLVNTNSIKKITSDDNGNARIHSNTAKGYVTVDQSYDDVKAMLANLPSFIAVNRLSSGSELIFNASELKVLKSNDAGQAVIVLNPKGFKITVTQDYDVIKNIVINL